MRPPSPQRLSALFGRRRRAERELYETRELYRRIVETSDEIVTLLSPDGRVLFTSPARERLLGWTDADLAESDPLALIHPDDRRRAFADIAAALEGAEPEPAQIRVRHRDGRYLVLEGTARAVRDDRGRPRYVVTTARDVTARRDAEQARELLAEQLVEAQRLEAIGRLAGGVAHDFNNLLTAISGYGEFLLGALGEDDPRRDDALEIMRAAERAAQLTHRLLAFGRRQVLQPAPVDVNVLVRDLEEMLRRVLGEDVTLAVDLQLELGEVFADATQLAQVLLDLAVNARDAMHGGGRLRIETRERRVEEQDGSLLPGDYVVLTVADNGVGMSDSTLRRVFEPFFTTKEFGAGSGLGLASAYGVVRQSGGEIRVSSEEGHGTRFDVWLPRTAAPSALGPTAAPAHSPAAAAGAVDRTVLLVEDEERVRRVIARALAAEGYRILEAGHPHDALELARGHEGAIDVLVTDVVMPGMSGCELAELLSVRRPATRILYISGYSEGRLVESGGPKRGARFLEKPFLPETLARAVRETLDGDDLPPLRIAA